MRVRFLVLLVVGSAALGACRGTADQNPAASAPELTWNYFDTKSQGSQDYLGHANVFGVYGDALHITLRVKDADGIKNVALGGSATYTCAQDDVGQVGYQHIPAETRTFSEVLTEFALIISVDLNYRCARYPFSGGHVTLIGTASDRGDVSASATMTIAIELP